VAGDSEADDSPPRVVATFADYPSMVTAMRLRAQERRLAITSPDVAAVCGLPDHYVAKLLAVTPVKRIGMISLGPLLAILGVRLQMVEDRDAIERLEHRLPTRNEAFAHSSAFTQTRSRAFMRKIGKKGGLSRWALKRQRVRSASHAAQIRWRGNGKANGKRNGHSK
jgi:hypothetical protein